VQSILQVVLTGLLNHCVIASVDRGYGSLRSQGRRKKVLQNNETRPRGAMRPSYAISFTLLKQGGRRESRAPIAPAVVHKMRTSRPQVNRIIRLSLHNGLRPIRDLPGEPCTLPPSPCGLTMHREPG